MKTGIGHENLSDMELRLLGYQLATAEILYHLPDHPGLLQSFTWQTLDLAPRFPRLCRFLDYWTHNIEGTLHSVRVASRALIAPYELRLAKGEFRLH
ncbi:MAG: Usg family protein [Alphaproteobacteria bacterium]|nr:MAG: Usg family protein [Alphaproteobacteria bacterium]